MSTSIKVNELKYNIDRDALSRIYDFFTIETSEKYIKQGSYILDASSLCNDIKSIKFETGQKVLFMMKKDSENRKKIKTLFKEISDGDNYFFQQTKIDEIADYLLIQLLLNALGSYESDFLKFNNLTGHLYCFHPNWIKRGKEKNDSVIWKVPCLEIAVTKDLCINLLVRTFTSSRLRNKITFKKRKYEEYPKYVFAANNTLCRRLEDDNTDCFIMRQVDGVKSEITFLNIQCKEKFDQSKIGVLNNVIQFFNEKYQGMCNIGFAEKQVEHRLDYSKALQKENIKRIKEILSQKEIHIVDKVGDNYSPEFCKDIKKLLSEKYDVEATVGKKINKDGLNILVIHNAEYYEGVEDPHDKIYEGIAVQHVTLEDFAGNSEFAISTIVHEIIIKEDLKDNKISLFDWSQTGIEEPVSFGIETQINEVNRYFFMKVASDGSFEIKEQEFTLFDMNEYTELIDVFENAKTNSEIVRGVIRFEDGNIAAIKDTGLFTLPEMDSINKLLTNGDNMLRGKERREELLSSCLDIKTYKEKDADFYFVGTIGDGMRPSIQRASVIRKIEGINVSRICFDKFLPLMNVSFVINGQLTVIPFPFKYLREYVVLIKR